MDTDSQLSESLYRTHTHAHTSIQPGFSHSFIHSFAKHNDNDNRNNFFLSCSKSREKKRNEKNLRKTTEATEMWAISIFRQNWSVSLTKIVGRFSNNDKMTLSPSTTTTTGDSITAKPTELL